MYVKHPTMDEDGSVTVTLPDGMVKVLPMVEGVIDWPEGVPLHNRFVPSPEPAALREMKRQAKEEELRKLAAELGLEVSGHTSVGDAKKPTGKKGA